MVHDRYVRVGKIGQADEPPSFRLAGKSAVERGGVDGAAFERLTADGVNSTDDWLTPSSEAGELSIVVPVRAHDFENQQVVMGFRSSFSRT
jgi:tRNA(Phe) wybutosine-synthesizing methylase Tyw3